MNNTPESLVPAGTGIGDVLELFKQLPADKISLMMDQLDVVKKEELHNYDGYVQLCRSNEVDPVEEDIFLKDPSAHVKEMYTRALPKILEPVPQQYRDAILPVLKNAITNSAAYRDHKKLTSDLLYAVAKAIGIPAGWASMLQRMI